MENANLEQELINVTWTSDDDNDDDDSNTSAIYLAPSSRSFAQQRRCDLAMSFAINSIGAGIVCLLGFVGNALSFAILSRDKSTSAVAAFLLKSLAFTDNLFLSVWFVHSSLKDAFAYFGWEKGFHVSYYYLQIYSYPLVFVGQTATIWLTVLIAASRYVAVCLPYRASAYCNLSITKRGVAGVLLFSAVYNAPRFFETELGTVTRRNVTDYQLFRSAMGENAIYVLVYFDILYYIFSFVLPLLLLLGLNTRLTVAYRAIRKKRTAMRLNHRKDGGHEQSITLVMIVVIVVFMVCNAPARLVQMVFQYSAQRCPTLPFFLTRLSTLLEVISSSANFLVYVAFRKQFRQAVCQCLRNNVCHPEGKRNSIDMAVTVEESLTTFGREIPVETVRQTVL